MVRLMPEIFKWKNRMTGLTRALLIIARKELADRCFFSEDTENRMQIIEDVKQILSEWLGFHDKSGMQLSNYDSWLERYYADKIYGDGSDDKIKPWSEIEKKKQQYGKKLFSNKKADKNDMLAITYERIIADAIYLGPLRQYYLSCRQGCGERLYKKGKKINPDNKKGAEYIDNILKLICAYLIKKNYTGNKANHINHADLAHWAQNREIFKGEYFKDMEFSGQKLIMKKTISNHYTKMSICPEYLKEYEFQIIPLSEKERMPDGYEVFADAGAGKPLEKRY